MNECELGFREFLIDIKSAITAPARRFSVIHERGALWGSLVLLIVPAYFGFSYVGGIYFNRDPFPGYSFVLPAVVATIVVLLKVYLIHFFGRLFEGKGRYSKATGTFRDILAVFGYTSIPSTLAAIVALLIFILIPEQVSILLRDFRALAVSVMIAVGLACFIWNLILVVLALRLVYPMRDVKIVFSFILGSILVGFRVLGTAMVVSPAHVNLIYVQPLLSERLHRLFEVDATAHNSKGNVNVPVDRLRYRVRQPARFELATFETGGAEPGRERRRGWLILGASEFSLADQSMGRIVGEPGDTVALVSGKLNLNGQLWDEPYIVPEYRSEVSVVATRLGSSQYFILPEDRRLVESHRKDLVVDRALITGRAIMNKWPLGWWFNRPTVFLKPFPEKAPY